MPFVTTVRLGRAMHKHATPAAPDRGSFVSPSCVTRHQWVVRLRDLDCQNRAVDADEILRRLDDHLAVANEHMARANEHMARGNELWAENRRELREMSARLDRVTQAFLDELRE